jgi:hypothetical protein
MVQILPHEQRVIEESEELDKKISALSHFMVGPVFTGLTDEERLLLEQQWGYMAGYYNTLQRRIALFGNKKP